MHHGIIAGLVDEIGLVEQIDQQLGNHPTLSTKSQGDLVKMPNLKSIIAFKLP
ncbi:MAG TPA: hypothetical protein V6D30_06155 [Leptolyngbyaceae cyanobacterium]